MIKYSSFQVFLTCFFALLLVETQTAAQSETCGTIGNGGLLIVSVELNDHPCQAVVDTGASHHIFDRTLIPFLRQFESSNSGASIEVCRSQRVKAGLLRDTVGVGSGVADLSEISRAAKVPIDMLLGVPLLLGRTIRISPSRENFVITDRISKDEGGISIRLDESGRPCVPITIAGKTLIALIDTGSNADVTMESNAFENMVRHSEENHTLSTVSALSFQSKSQRRQIDACEVTLGSNIVRSASITESGMTKIGMGFLTCFDAEIDLHNMRLRLATSQEQ